MQHELLSRVIVAQRVVARALGTQPYDPPLMIALQISMRLDEQFSFAHSPEFGGTRSIEAGGDVRFQHGTSTRPTHLSETIKLEPYSHPMRCIPYSGAKTKTGADAPVS
jgi:hypothetical protein